ncbi:MAG: hypothetical protein AB7Y46_07820 [Armatimonadota bacterium]
MRWLWLPVALLGVALLWEGLRWEQAEAVWRHATQLCLACIGLG